MLGIEPGTSCIQVIYANGLLTTTPWPFDIRFPFFNLHIQIHTKMHKNWSELLLQQRFRQAFWTHHDLKYMGTGQYAISQVQNLLYALDFKLLCLIFRNLSDFQFQQQWWRIHPSARLFIIPKTMKHEIFVISYVIQVHISDKFTTTPLSKIQGRLHSRTQWGK